MPTLQGHGGVKHIQEMVAAMMLPVMMLIIMVTYLNLGFGWSINGGVFGMAESEAWNEETTIAQLPWTSEILTISSGNVSVDGVSHTNSCNIYLPVS